jgi:hypothetical protein
MIKWIVVPSLFIVISFSLVYGLDGSDVKIENETKPTVVSDNSTLNPANSTSSSLNVTTFVMPTTKSTGIKNYS